jgi:outer membrane protein assembly factor BamB
LYHLFPAHYFYAILPNGTIKWKYKVGPAGASFIIGIAIGEDGTLYFASGNGFFYALNKNGSLKWKLEISRFGWESFASPAIW